jgi:N-glycosidase YbiA
MVQLFVCKGCKYVFNPDSPNTHYCCDVCRNNSNNEVITLEEEHHNCLRYIVEELKICPLCKLLHYNKLENCCLECDGKGTHSDICKRILIDANNLYYPKICKNTKCKKIFTSSKDYCCEECWHGKKNGIAHEPLCTIIKTIKPPDYNPLSIHSDNTVYFSSTLDSGAYSALSNNYVCDMIIDGVKYRSVDQYFHAQKFIKVPTKNAKIAAKIAKQIIDSKPEEAYNIASFNTEFYNSDRSNKNPWHVQKEDVIRSALERKFKDKVLKNILLSTENKTLVFYSPYDTEWGVGRHGSGRNLLGRLLMEVRDRLLEKELNQNQVGGDQINYTLKYLKLRRWFDNALHSVAI